MASTIRRSKPKLCPWRLVITIVFLLIGLQSVSVSARTTHPIVTFSSSPSLSQPEGGCTGHTCRMLCQYGFATDERGCPLCRCYDPCSEVQCPGSLTCQLEEQPCSRPPCLPVPTCKKGRSLESACPIGTPLVMPGSGTRGGPERPFLCGIAPGQPGCPPPYTCSVAPGNDYGVCCPSGPLPLRITKPGECPAPPSSPEESVAICARTSSCRGDLECPGEDKCCLGCCTRPTSVSECIRLRALAVMLSVSELEGRGYVPQCEPSGAFSPRQCSRNGRVCWCVDYHGNKVPGSMAAGNQVQCPAHSDKSRGRSLDTARQCPSTGQCANICQFGFKTDADGCPTCECDDSCAAKICGPNEVCEARTENGCEGSLCIATPVCIPVKNNETTSTTTSYDNVSGASAIDEETTKADNIDGEDASDTTTTESEESTTTEMSDVTTTPKAMTTPAAFITDGDYDAGERNQIDRDDIDEIRRKEDVEEEDEEERPLSMCEYLRDFGDKMEGTQDGMTLALPSPSCKTDGAFNDTQCDNGQCWCVDSFGTEIPETRSKGVDPGCEALRTKLDCLDLTCRLACDFGFTLTPDTRCPLCECRDPCAGIDCGSGKECQMVEVACGKNEYCPPVPACLPRKLGQCPYLVPLNSGSCEYQCRSDYNCNGTEKCCSNGCGTQCVQPMVMTECQHKRAIVQHESHESGIPARHIFVPACREEDGAFEPVQCHPTTGQCWCVDAHGTEVAGTRAAPGVRPNCQAAKSCPTLQCSESCPHGSQLDASGCPTCECRDPCAGIACRGDGESCRLVDVECADPPCNPIPMCLPRRENPCPTGGPLKDNIGSWVRCGPNGSSCPSSHKCELSPLDEYAVCCPKPRDVCFEPVSEGLCSLANDPKWHFNPERNICEKLADGQCGAQHNIFESREACDAVCPVLSQCERLREKNQRAAEKYKKWTFIPECARDTGRWLPLQCLPQVGVCWCVNPDGRPVEGSLTRDKPAPSCNSRQARRRMDHDDAPSVLEDLIHQLMLWEAPTETSETKQEQGLHRTRCLALRAKSNPNTFGLHCDENGGFAPMQCYSARRDSECWCVDEAGNQLAGTSTFKRGQKLCLPTPVAAVEVTLGFQVNEITEKLAESAREKVAHRVKQALATIGGSPHGEVLVERTPELLLAKFELVGPGKVDRAFLLEEMVQAGSLTVPLTEGGAQVVADMTKSRFSHRAADPQDNLIQPAERVVALEHREIVSESTVSATTPYHTAIVVLSIASSFIIVILALLAALYRRRMLAASSHKISRQDEMFANCDPPVFVVRLNKSKNAQ